MNSTTIQQNLDHKLIDQHVSDFHRDGFVVLKQIFPKSTLKKWSEEFKPLLEQHIEREGHRKNRGAQRYYVTLPFAGTFADPSIYENDLILAIVEKLVGEHFVMCQLATDTPLRGSEYQNIHRDTPPLFPEWGVETPSFQLAVNFPLCDVTSENGPLEVVRGTHRMTKEEGMALIESGEKKIEQVLMELGDVIVRDVRGLHRGTPNNTDVPRPMVVIGYSRKWMFRPEVSIHVPKSTQAGLTERARKMLRFNPVIESIEQMPGEEEYQEFAY